MVERCLGTFHSTLIRRGAYHRNTNRTRYRRQTAPDYHRRRRGRDQLPHCILDDRTTLERRNRCRDPIGHQTQLPNSSLNLQRPLSAPSQTVERHSAFFLLYLIARVTVALLVFG